MVNIDSFSAFHGAERVKYDSETDTVAQSGSKPSNVFAKIWDWMTRSKEDVQANKETVREFIDQVKEEYPDVGDMATAGLASHLAKGKPLTGRRIHEVIDLADKLKAKSLKEKEPETTTTKIEKTAPETVVPVKPKVVFDPEVNKALGYNGIVLSMEGKLNANQHRVDVSALLPSEIGSIYAYTTSDRPYGFNFMNSALREAKVDAPIMPAVRAATEGLSKLPDFTEGGGLCYRTISHSGIFMEQYKVGETITELAFSSAHKWSHGQSKGIDPENSSGITLIIEGKHGKDVSGISKFPDEDEVLFKPLTRFEVTERSVNKSGGAVIRLKEVD